jgi:hypothetical protein
MDSHTLRAGALHHSLLIALVAQYLSNATSRALICLVRVHALFSIDYCRCFRGLRSGSCASKSVEMERSLYSCNRGLQARGTCGLRRVGSSTSRLASTLAMKRRHRHPRRRDRCQAPLRPIWVCAHGLPSIPCSLVSLSRASVFLASRLCIQGPGTSICCRAICPFSHGFPCANPGKLSALRCC